MCVDTSQRDRNRTWKYLETFIKIDNVILCLLSIISYTLITNFINIKMNYEYFMYLYFISSGKLKTAKYYISPHQNTVQFVRTTIYSYKDCRNQGIG